ncbi:glycosyltransferase [Streptomyces sp. NPDC058255]|uniref:glycosyltransferase n=1 Tax=Streptomyces sp. NPDC058255 TaxID=3346407 RepID=UPI0036F065DA
MTPINTDLDYMAMGPPLVSFDLREARVSAGDAALYAPANDEAEFAKLIALLLDDPQKRAQMGKVGQERISGQLSWRNSQASLLAAYAAACRDHTPVSATDPVRTGKRQRR